MKKLHTLLSRIGLILSILFYPVLAYRWSKRIPGKHDYQRYDFNSLAFLGIFILALMAFRMCWMWLHSDDSPASILLGMGCLLFMYGLFGFCTFWKITKMQDLKIA